MNKRWLYFLIAPAGPIVEGLRQLSKQFGDGGDAELLNFTTPIAMASDPKTVVAYGGCTGPVGDQTVAALEAMVAAGSIPASVSWVRTVNEGGFPRIVKSSDAATQAWIDGLGELDWNPGLGEADPAINRLPRFDMPTALAAVGMAVHTEEL